MIFLYVRESEDPKTCVAQMLKEGLSDLGMEEKPLGREESGRPFLEGGPRISLSHTNGGAALALSLGGPVGVDVERLRPLRPGLPRRVMSDREWEWYTFRGERPEDFFTLWTLKESYYKYLGTGLPGFPAETEFCLTDGLWRLRGSPLHFLTTQKGPLFLALCGEEQEVTFR